MTIPCSKEADIAELKTDSKWIKDAVGRVEKKTDKILVSHTTLKVKIATYSGIAGTLAGIVGSAVIKYFWK